ncbi:hypothetical protein ABZ791_35775 [Streptomyces huasconensis]|uniref:Uncharacterized protein n=1 Tax=Streptomyces huasconensis TaxID=1854574 RepID=A0ABV3M2L7_9ACTN
MSTVDALLAQSLLLHQPHVPSDVVGRDDLDYTRLTEDLLLQDDDGPDLADDRAAQSLTALCEAVVTRCTKDAAATGQAAQQAQAIIVQKRQKEAAEAAASAAQQAKENAAKRINPADNPRNDTVNISGSGNWAMKVSTWTGRAGTIAHTP